MSSIIKTNASESSVEMLGFERYSCGDGYGYGPLVGDSYDVNFYSETDLGVQALFAQVELITESVEHGNESGHLKLSTVKEGVLYDNLFLQAGGNVGIGTDNPQQALHVLGNIRTSDNVIIADGYLKFEDTISYPGVSTIGVWRQTDGGLTFQGSGSVFDLQFANQGGDTVVAVPSDEKVLYVNGSVGIGTDSPEEKLHVYDSDGDSYIQLDGVGSGHAAGIKMNTNGGEWTVKAHHLDATNYPLQFYFDDSESQFMQFTKYGTLGLNVNPEYHLDIDINVTAGSGIVRGMRIFRSIDENEGYIKVGSSSPDNDDFSPFIIAKGTRSNGFEIRAIPEEDQSTNHDCMIIRGVDPDDENSATESSPVLHIMNWATTVAKFGTSSYALDVSGQVHATGFPTSSDMRFKKNVENIESVLDKVMQLRPVTFDWNERYAALDRAVSHKQIGFIGQEMEQLFPEVVSTWKDRKANENGKFVNKQGQTIETEMVNAEVYDKLTGKPMECDEDFYKGIEYGRLSVVAIQAIRELKAEIDKLKAEIDKLKIR